MKITYYGHAALQVDVAGKTILVDPFISPNPSAFAIDVAALQADYILLTHAHGDHIADVETIAQQTNAVIVANAEIAGYYEAKGFKSHPMNHGGAWKFDFGTLKMVNAIHSSSFPDGSYGGNPAGFVLQAENQTIYIAGDTALTMDMKLIPMRYNLDLAILPIGDNFTMDYVDAVTAADFLQVNRVLAYHYDTFGFIKVDTQQAATAFKNAGKELVLLQIGEHLEL